MFNFRQIKLFKTFKRKLLRSFQKNQVKKPKLVNKNVEEKATKIINLAGYTILTLAILDYIFLLISANFFEPSWGYNTAGNLVENVWAFLLGFLLIFYRRDQELIRPREFTFLSLLSWLALIIGIGYFLITPIIIGNAFRINRSQQSQAIIQIKQQDLQAQKYSQQLNAASSEQISGLFENYQQQVPELQIDSVESFREQLITDLKQKQDIARRQIKTTSKKQKINLLKNTIKWIVGAIISGISFILIWRYTKWTRVGY